MTFKLLTEHHLEQEAAQARLSLRMSKSQIVGITCHGSNCKKKTHDGIFLVCAHFMLYFFSRLFQLAAAVLFHFLHLWNGGGVECKSWHFIHFLWFNYTDM